MLICQSTRPNEGQPPAGSTSEAGATTSSARRQPPVPRYQPTESTSSGTVTECSSGQSGRPQMGQGDSNTTSTGSSESGSRPALRRNTSGSKGRPPVVASGARGRAKPTLIRRKSSQSKPQQPTAARPPQPTLRSPVAGRGIEEAAGGAAPLNNVPGMLNIPTECNKC